MKRLSIPLIVASLEMAIIILGLAAPIIAGGGFYFVMATLLCAAVIVFFVRYAASRYCK